MIEEAAIRRGSDVDIYWTLKVQASLDSSRTEVLDALRDLVYNGRQHPRPFEIAAVPQIEAAETNVVTSGSAHKVYICADKLRYDSEACKRQAPNLLSASLFTVLD